MDQRLREAAQHGRIGDLYTLIGEDANILDRFDQVPFINTPLHIAASFGQAQFAMEMVNLKPSFSRKLNQYGFSPMHLALRNGHHQMVLRLLAVDRDLVRVKGREGVTPLHFAAENELENILAEFLVACPKSIQDLTIRKEIALHIAANNGMVEALKVLLGWLKKVDHKAILNWEDDDGNTILDITISKIQGLTEDQGEQSGYKSIRNMLRGAGAATASSLTPIDTLAEFLKKSIFRLSINYRIVMHREEINFTNEDRNAILVCAVLIATTTFQSVVNPPAGVTQSKNSPATATITNATMATTTPGNGSLPHYGVGTSVDNTKLWFPFWMFNSIAFFYSIIAIYIHMGLKRNIMILYNIVPLTICYVLALLTVAPNSLPMIYLFISIFVAVLAQKLFNFCCRKGGDSRHIRSLLKRWPSFHREMAEIENSE